MTERLLQTSLFRLAEAHGIYARKMQAVGHTGFPDVMLAYGGKVIFVELKSPTKRGILSEKQKREIGRLEAAGASVHIAETKASVEEIVKNILRPSYDKRGRRLDNTTGSHTR